MDRDKAKRATELIEEIDELKSYKRITHDGIHFEIAEHFGNNPRRITIGKKHTHNFVKVLDNIINELEQELLDL